MASKINPKFKNTPNKSYIVNDGKFGQKLIWDSRSVAINMTVLILVDSFEPYVLVSKRGPNAADFQGLMNIVAGYIDKDETGIEAAYREVWEETGLDLQKLIKEGGIIHEDLDQPWFVNTDPAENRQNVSLRYGIVLNTSEIPKLNTNNNEVEGEVEDPQWIPISHIDNYKWAFNHDKTIKSYAKYVGLWNSYIK